MVKCLPVQSNIEKHNDICDKIILQNFAIVSLRQNEEEILTLDSISTIHAFQACAFKHSAASTVESQSIHYIFIFSIIEPYKSIIIPDTNIKVINKAFKIFSDIIPKNLTANKLSIFDIPVLNHPEI